MEPCINIQCRPSPLVWEPTGRAAPAALADEDGFTLQDEDGNTLQPD